MKIFLNFLFYFSKKFNKLPENEIELSQTNFFYVNRLLNRSHSLILSLLIYSTYQIKLDIYQNATNAQWEKKLKCWLNFMHRIFFLLPKSRLILFFSLFAKLFEKAPLNLNRNFYFLLRCWFATPLIGACTCI